MCSHSVQTCWVCPAHAYTSYYCYGSRPVILLWLLYHYCDTQRENLVSVHKAVSVLVQLRELPGQRIHVFYVDSALHQDFFAHVPSHLSGETPD